MLLLLLLLVVVVVVVVVGLVYVIYMSEETSITDLSLRKNLVLNGHEFL